MTNQSTTVSICRDEDCPACDWPEMYSELDITEGQPIRLVAVGCRKCGLRQEVEA